MIMNPRFLMLLALVAGPFFYVPTTSAQNALDLDGVNDFVQTTFSGITGTNPRTVEAWINTTANCNPSVGGVQQIITDWGQFVNGQRFTFNILWANAIRIEVGGNGLSGTIAVNDGLWHHVAVVYNPTLSSQFSLYVDGVLDVAGNLTVGVATASGNMRIGERVDVARHFEGKIDEVRVWNTARSQADLQAAMSAELCGAQPGLVAYYQFNEGVAGAANPALTSLPDLSGNGYNGSLLNFALLGSTSNWVTGPSIAPGISIGSETVITCNEYLSPSGKFLWTNSGTYSDTLMNASGCDSVIVVSLTVIGASTDSISLTECAPLLSPSGKYLWSATGTYADTIASAAGCDSIISVDLVINAPSGDTIVVDECNSFVSPSGKYTWGISGVFTDTLSNQLGCDSVITVDLTLGYSSNFFNTEFSCGPFLSPSGKYAWSSSGTYTDTLINADGCEDFFTIDLSVVLIDTTVTNFTDSLAANSPGLIYQWLDCDGGYAQISGAMSQGYKPEKTGSYAVEIISNVCADTSACFFVAVANDGLARHSFGPQVKVFPSPVTSDLYLDLGETVANLEIELLTLLGQQVLHQQHQRMESTRLDLSGLPAGIYILRLRDDSRQSVFQVQVQQ